MAGTEFGGGQDTKCPVPGALISSPGHWALALDSRALPLPPRAMKADTFAHLVVLETTLDAEIGYRLEHPPASTERWVEGMVARVSDLVDRIDALDAVAAARAYDALVDFLTELPEEETALVEQAVRLKRAVDRIVERGMEAADLAAPPTWAAVVDELLGVLSAEYASAMDEQGDPRPRQHLRARYLVNRARAAADRMVAGEPAARRAEVRSALDRLSFAVHNRRLRPAEVEELAGAARRLTARYRPSNLTRIGAFVLGQLLRRRPGDAEPA